MNLYIHQGYSANSVNPSLKRENNEEDINYIMENIYNLNPEQNIAMQEIDKAVLILAGAGSGKTRVITHKFAYLVKEHNIFPWTILAVTFTNKAANEMKERVLQMLDIDPSESKKTRGLWINTFHSICGRILRRDIDKLGYTSNFTIYDPDDCDKVIKEIYKAQNMDPQKFKATQNYISKWKNNFISPAEALKDIDNSLERLTQTYAMAYEAYEKKMKENNALDFDDLIMKTIELFTEFPEVLEEYRNRFDYIMVDEFQDTNKSQYMLIKMLAKENNISVVGDDDQSIYSWRGADISNILERFPTKDFKNCRLVKLEQNYRSTNTILRAANSVIANNKNRLTKNLWSNLGDGDKLQYFSTESDRDEASIVGGKIHKLLKTYKNENIAVFYRMNFQSRNIEEILRKRKIPYKIFGGTKFYDRKEIKDLLAYLKVIANKQDSIATKRIINVPKRAIGKKTIDKVNELAEKYNLTFFEAVEYGCEENLFGKTTITKLNTFLELIGELSKYKEKKSIGELFKYVLKEVEYVKHLRKDCKDDGEYRDRIANIEELERSILSYEKEFDEGLSLDEDDVPFGLGEQNRASEETPSKPTLENYLTEISLQTDIDGLDEESGYVSLMTIHKSKGLEFDSVFVMGCDEGILPHYNYDDMENPAVLEEERRLFYVALTRARKRLYLSSARERFSQGRMSSYDISRFIGNIDERFIEYDNMATSESKPQKEQWEIDYNKRRSQAQKQMSKVKTKPQNKIIKSLNGVSVNDVLYHPSFGKVVVTGIRKNAAVDSLVVKDNQGKVRNLILKYANLSKTPY